MVAYGGLRASGCEKRRLLQVEYYIYTELRPLAKIVTLAVSKGL